LPMTTLPRNSLKPLSYGPRKDLRSRKFFFPAPPPPRNPRFKVSPLLFPWPPCPLSFHIPFKHFPTSRLPGHHGPRFFSQCPPPKGGFLASLPFSSSSSTDPMFAVNFFFNSSTLFKAKSPFPLPRTWKTFFLSFLLQRPSASYTKVPLPHRRDYLRVRLLTSPCLFLSTTLSPSPLGFTGLGDSKPLSEQLVSKSKRLVETFPFLYPSPFLALRFWRALPFSPPYGRGRFVGLFLHSIPSLALDSICSRPPVPFFPILF